MAHGPGRGVWLLLGVLVLPTTGVLALRHAVGPEARAEGRNANARVWVTGFSVPGTRAGAPDLVVEAVSLVPERGAEIPLSSPTGTPLRVHPGELGGGRMALAAAGSVPAGRYAALKVGIAGARQRLPLVLALDSGRELDLVVGVKAQLSGARASLASLAQR